MTERRIAGIDAAAMSRNAEEAARLLRSLSNAHRLMVLCHLVEGERSVGELEALVGLSQSALSQHLARLRSEGLVETRRSGATIFYRVGDGKVMRVLSTLRDVYCH